MFILMTVFPAALTAAEVTETFPAWPTGTAIVTEQPTSAWPTGTDMVAESPVAHPFPFPGEPAGFSMIEHPEPYPFPFPGA